MLANMLLVVLFIVVLFMLLPDVFTVWFIGCDELPPWK